MATLLQGGWQHIFNASLSREWTPKYLGLEQLIKHALALSSHANGRTTCLVYLYWEPSDGDNIPEVTAHRAEVAELLSGVADAQPSLHALTYEQLFSEWAAISTDAGWRAEHVTQLRARYGDITI